MNTLTHSINTPKDTIEKDLIGRLNSGSQEAMEIIYKEHFTSLCIYANTLLADKNQATDIVQDLMMDIWNRRATLRLQNASIKTYLSQALRYKVYHSNKNLNVPLDIEEVALSTSTSDADIKELKHLVHKAINNLPERQRDCFILSRDKGYTYKEIAEELSLSPKTVDHHISKALSLLRTSLQSYFTTLATLIFILF